MKRFIALLFFCFISFVCHGASFAEVLKVGIFAEIPPFQYISSSGIVDQYDGYEIATIKAIAEDLGVTLQLENMEFDSIIMALKNQKIDVAIAGLTITPTRKRVVSFSIPYFTSSLIMLVPTDSPIKKATDMKGKRIVVLQGSTCEVAVKKMNLPYVALKGYPEAIIDLKNGKSDVVVMDEIVARRYCSNMKEIKIVEDVDTFGFEEFGIVVNKKNTQLLEKINASLKRLKESGKMDALLKNYL